MPIFEFECTLCSTKYERRWHTLTDYEKELERDKSIRCPKCNGEGLKMISRTSVQFNGEGFTPKYH